MLAMLPAPHVQRTKERAIPAILRVRAHDCHQQLFFGTDLLWACCLSELIPPPARGLCWNPCCQRNRNHLLVTHSAGAWLVLQHSNSSGSADSRSRLGLCEHRISRSTLQCTSRRSAQASSRRPSDCPAWLDHAGRQCSAEQGKVHEKEQQSAARENRKGAAYSQRPCK